MSDDDPTSAAPAVSAGRTTPIDRRSRLLLQVARRILGAGQLGEVADSAVAAQAALVPGAAHGFGVIDEETGAYTLIATHGMIPSAWHRGVPVPVEAIGANLDLLRRGEVDHVDDVDAVGRAAGVLASSGAGSLLIAPIVDGGVLMGTLHAVHFRAGAFTEEHVDVLEEIADLMRQSLQQLRFQRELEEAHRAALQASKAKSAFLANTSHELRTPLNAIIGYAELADEELAEIGATEIRQDVGKIRRAATHLLGLINEVLDLAKIEAGKLEFHHEPVPLGPLLHDVSESVRPLVERNGNRWVLAVAKDAPYVSTDRVRLVQILYNLIGNAAKFTRDGEIRLDVARRADQLEFAVTDTGIGIRAEKLPTLFEAFTQAHATQGEDFGGTGLGLTISKRYAERLGGDITVESTVGVGTTFRVRLPLI